MLGRVPRGLQPEEVALLDQLLCFKEAPQVEDLPSGQADETAHGEYTEVQNTRVGRLWWEEAEWHRRMEH